MAENREKTLLEKQQEEQNKALQNMLRIKPSSIRPGRSVEAVRSITRISKNDESQESH